MSEILSATGVGSSGGEPTDPEPATVPSFVIDLQVNYNAHNIVALSWARDNFNGGLSYDIYRNGVQIDTIYGGYTPRDSYTDYNVLPNTEYIYTIKIHDWSGNNYELSEPLITTTLADPNGVDTLAPSNIVLQYSSGDTTVGVQLMWTTALDDSGSVQYEIYRDGILIDTLVDGTYYNDPNVVSGSTYNYTIVATDATGNASSPLVIPSIVIP